MELLQLVDEQKHEEVKPYKMMFDLMSFEKVIIIGMSPLTVRFCFASLCSACCLA